MVDSYPSSSASTKLPPSSSSSEINSNNNSRAQQQQQQQPSTNVNSSGNTALVQRSQRHSAPSSYTVYRTRSSSSSGNQHQHQHQHQHRNRSEQTSSAGDDYTSRQSLYDLLQYLVVFFVTYIRFLLQRVLPFLPAPVFFNSFASASYSSSSFSSSSEPFITEPPEQQIQQQYLLTSPFRTKAPPSRKSSLQNPSSNSHCQRPCCRSSSFSGEPIIRSGSNIQSHGHRFSSNEVNNEVDDLIESSQIQSSAAAGPPSFPFNVFPLSLAVTLYRNCFDLNRFLELSRIPRYYKAAVQMRDRFRNLFRWRPTSPEELDQAESTILSYLKCPYKTYYVDIGKGWDLENVLIWTMEVPPKASMTGAAELSDTAESEPSSASQQLPQIIANPPAKSFDEQFVPAHLQGLPLVMVHGFAAGVALWSLNMDELSLKGKRHVFAFDLLGFAKSSRPKWTFPKFGSNMTALQQRKAEAETMEEYMVDSIEKWRRAIGGPLSEKFILLGHSFGGYLCTAYALRYPEHVAHVILADPWGYPADSHTRDRNSTHYTSSRQLPFWAQLMGRLLLDVFTPLAGLRAAGPWGPKIFKSLRPDLRKKFAKLAGEPELATTPEGDGNGENGEVDLPSSSSDEGEGEGGEGEGKEGAAGSLEDSDMIMNYIYHCNAHGRPSGEIAFKKLCTHTGWARMPMLERVMGLEPHITLSFIFGSRSWIDRQSGFQTKYILATAANSATALAVPPAATSSDTDTADQAAERVNVHILQGAGHHVYADNHEEFNQLVMNICTEVDCVLLQRAMEEQGNEFEWDEEEDDSFLQQQVAAGLVVPPSVMVINSGSVNGGGNVNGGGANGSNSNNGNWGESGGPGMSSNLTSSKLDLQKNAIPEEDSY